jgi:hypothetical protein
VDLNHFPMKYNVFSNGQVEPITDYGVQQDPEQAISVNHPDTDTYVHFTHIFHRDICYCALYMSYVVQPLLCITFTPRACERTIWCTCCMMWSFRYRAYLAYVVHPNVYVWRFGCHLYLVCAFVQMVHTVYV